MRNTPFVMLALVAGLLGLLAFREANGARKDRIALATAVSERDALRDRLTALENYQQARAAENTASPAPETTPPPPPSPAAGFSASTVPPSRVRMAQPMAAFDSPEMRQLMALQQKSRLDGRYAALFKALGLPPAQLEQFKQLLVDRQNAAVDVIAATRQQALPGAGGGAIPALVDQEHTHIDESIRELLGDAGYDEYQDFERTASERTVVEQLATRLSYSEAPLTAEQSETLVNLLSAERATRGVNPSAPAAGTAAIFAGGSGHATFTFATQVGPVAAGATITDDSLAGAQTVLSEAQLAAFRQLQAEQHAQQAMHDQLRRTVFATEAGAVLTELPTTSIPASGPP